MPFNNNGLFNTKDFYTNKTTSSGTSQVGHKKAFTKKELELKLKEAKKRKKEKFAQKIKAMEEISEKEKNKWKSFNNKVTFCLKLNIHAIKIKIKSTIPIFFAKSFRLKRGKVW